MTLDKGGHRQVSPEAAARHFAFEVLMQTSRSMPPVSSHSLLRIEEGDLVGGKDLPTVRHLTFPA